MDDPPLRKPSRLRMDFPLVSWGSFMGDSPSLTHPPTHSPLHSYLVSAGHMPCPGDTTQTLIVTPVRPQSGNNKKKAINKKLSKLYSVSGWDRCCEGNKAEKGGWMEDGGWGRPRWWVCLTGDLRGWRRQPRGCEAWRAYQADIPGTKPGEQRGWRRGQWRCRPSVERTCLLMV